MHKNKRLIADMTSPKESSRCVSHLTKFQADIYTRMHLTDVNTPRGYDVMDNQTIHLGDGPRFASSQTHWQRNKFSSMVAPKKSRAVGWAQQDLAELQTIPAYPTNKLFFQDDGSTVHIPQSQPPITKQYESYSRPDFQ